MTTELAIVKERNINFIVSSFSIIKMQMKLINKIGVKISAIICDTYQPIPVNIDKNKRTIMK